MLFLDGHSKAEPGAIRRLIEDVEHLHGSAVVTPRVGSLDVEPWRTDLANVGNGYWMKLDTFECGWLDLGRMHPTVERGRRFYESPGAHRLCAGG